MRAQVVPPILPAKLRLSPLPAIFVERPRLTTLLSQSQGRSVTTIIAPAGYGKSTLIADWHRTVHVRARRFVSLTLDSRDNDPVRFWSHLIAAVNALGVPTAPELVPLLRDEIRDSPTSLPEAFLAPLLENLETTMQRGILVLDDLQEVSNPTVREGLGLLLADLPTTMRAVLLSRSVISGVNLHRLRARGDVQELAQPDLAFTRNESRELLRRVAPAADLDDQGVDPLIDRTAGWVTGLQFAGASLRHAQQPAKYVQDIAGHSRDIAEFLLGEVLDGQPESLKDFLLDTSLLETLTADSCHALTGRDDCLALLRQLESAGLFVLPVDDSRERYRYQPMFAEFLRSELRCQTPARQSRQHALASVFYEQAGDAPASIDHALAAGAHDRAAAMMVPLVADMHRRGLDATLQRWFAAIPDATISATPALALKQAWMHAYVGRPTDVLLWCERADATRDPDDGIAAESACLRTLAHRTLGDINATLRWGAKAAELLDIRDAVHGDDDAYSRLAMTDALAEIYGLAGQPEAGVALLRSNSNRTLNRGNIFAAVALPGKMAALESELGHLNLVAFYADQAFESAARLGVAGKPPTADAEVAHGELFWERDQLPESAAAFRTAIDAAGKSERIWIQARALLGLARSKLSQQQPTEASAVLETAHRLYRWGTPPPFLVAALAEARARFLIQVGDLKGASRSVETFALVSDEPVRLAQLEVMLHLANGRLDQAHRGVTAAMTGVAVMRTRDAVRWSVLAALIAEARSESTATAELLHAVSIGQQHGFIRSIIEPAAPLVAANARNLMNAASHDSRLTMDYLRGLDQAARREMGRTPQDRYRTGRMPSQEPFTEGELAVIHYLPSELTYSEIAARRFVSVNTVKSQLKSIYRKLGVKTRVSAAESCRKLGLL